MTLLLALGACSGSHTSSLPALASQIVPATSASTPIKHVVLVVQENRTFNDFFATFPGATGVTVGLGKSGNKIVQIPLTETRLKVPLLLNHQYAEYLVAKDGGKMDGFNLIRNSHQVEGSQPYEYVNPADIAPYWTMAKEYGLANAMFTTQGSASFTGHQDLIRGGTKIDNGASMIDIPAHSGHEWGCDSLPGTMTSLITTTLKYERDTGPYPCTSYFPYGGSKYETLRDLLDAKDVSWKYYAEPDDKSGGIWSAFDVIAPVRNGPEWQTNVSTPPTNIFSDISNGSLAAMSWVTPDKANSDHPTSATDTGPSWVASIVNAIGQSQYWNSTAIVVVWDDWGGFYDPVAPPPADDQGGPGFRVPMILVSPYARETSSSQPGYISRTTYEFGSIVRFVEDTFNLGRLGTTDETTKSIADMFDFTQPPRTFQVIPAKYSRAYFLRQKPSLQPVDTE